MEVDSDVDIEHVPKRPRLDTNEVTPSSVKEKSPLPPSEAAAKKSQVVIGVNEVTRSLERGGLRAVVVCLSVRIPLLHEHIQILSATRDVPCIGVYHMSQAIAHKLGLKSATAIGLKVFSYSSNLNQTHINYVPTTVEPHYAYYSGTSLFQ